MKWKYRIKVYDYLRRFDDKYEVVKRYMPQRKEDSLLGRLGGWFSISQLSCDTEAEARQIIENDRAYWELRSRNSKSEYINID
jgi:hypothetical protein